MNFKIGYGYDVHRLEEGETLILGGIGIDHHKGLKGHSDADVVIHAICDALLGAINQGDIGKHFPPDNPEYKNIDSKRILSHIHQLVQNSGFLIGNIDTTVCLQKPKLQPYIHEMRSTIASTLAIPEESISIKATTTEGLGFEGREEGISAHAVVLIRGRDS